MNIKEYALYTDCKLENGNYVTGVFRTRDKNIFERAKNKSIDNDTFIKFEILEVVYEEKKFFQGSFL